MATCVPSVLEQGGRGDTVEQAIDLWEIRWDEEFLEQEDPKLITVSTQLCDWSWLGESGAPKTVLRPLLKNSIVAAQPLDSD